MSPNSGSIKIMPEPCHSEYYVILPPLKTTYRKGKGYSIWREVRESMPAPAFLPHRHRHLISDHCNVYLKSSENSSLWYHGSRLCYCECKEEQSRLSKVLINESSIEYLLYAKHYGLNPNCYSSRSLFLLCEIKYICWFINSLYSQQWLKTL